jgi:hypothetical protein
VIAALGARVLIITELHRLAGVDAVPAAPALAARPGRTAQARPGRALADDHDGPGQQATATASIMMSDGRLRLFRLGNYSDWRHGPGRRMPGHRRTGHFTLLQQPPRFLV